MMIGFWLTPPRIFPAYSASKVTLPSVSFSNMIIFNLLNQGEKAAFITFYFVGTPEIAEEKEETVFILETWMEFLQQSEFHDQVGLLNWVTV